MLGKYWLFFFHYSDHRKWCSFLWLQKQWSCYRCCAFWCISYACLVPAGPSVTIEWYTQWKAFSINENLFHWFKKGIWYSFTWPIISWMTWMWSALLNPVLKPACITRCVACSTSGRVFHTWYGYLWYWEIKLHCTCLECLWRSRHLLCVKYGLWSLETLKSGETWYLKGTTSAKIHLQIYKDYKEVVSGSTAWKSVQLFNDGYKNLCDHETEQVTIFSVVNSVVCAHTTHYTEQTIHYNIILHAFSRHITFTHEILYEILNYQKLCVHWVQKK